MWSIQGTESEEELCEKFKMEVQNTLSTVSDAATKKRKWTSTQELIDTFYTPSAKRMCSNISCP